MSCDLQRAMHQHRLIHRYSHGHEGHDATGGFQQQQRKREGAQQKKHPRSEKAKVQRWNRFNEKRAESRKQYKQWSAQIKEDGKLTLAHPPPLPQRVEYSPSQVTRTTHSSIKHAPATSSSRTSWWRHHVDLPAQQITPNSTHKRTPAGGRERNFHVVFWNVEGLYENGKYDMLFLLMKKHTALTSSVCKKPRQIQYTTSQEKDT
jgi:hypothetical protein